MLRPTCEVQSAINHCYLRASAEVMLRFRAFVLDRMPQSVAQAGGLVTSLVLFLRQLADKFTRMKPANAGNISRMHALYRNNLLARHTTCLLSV